jgi:hypothetical protein
MGGKVSSRSLLQILSLSSNFLSKEYNSYCVAENGLVCHRGGYPKLDLAHSGHFEMYKVSQYSTPVSQKITRVVAPFTFWNPKIQSTKVCIK